MAVVVDPSLSLSLWCSGVEVGWEMLLQECFSSPFQTLHEMKSKHTCWWPLERELAWSKWLCSGCFGSRMLLRLQERPKAESDEEGTRTCGPPSGSTERS
jgi:hypothetical protein